MAVVVVQHGVHPHPLPVTTPAIGDLKGGRRHVLPCPQKAKVTACTGKYLHIELHGIGPSPRYKQKSLLLIVLNTRAARICFLVSHRGT